MRLRGLISVVVGVLAGVGVCRHRASACGGGSATPIMALPGPGATEVSPFTTLVLITPSAGWPATLQLTAAGANVPLDSVIPKGGGLTSKGGAFFSTLRVGLESSTDYVLSYADTTGVHELTRFTTSASYTKDPGTPAQLGTLRLWRVHYPTSWVGTGRCVFSEFEGYFALDFAPAVIPGTPAGEVVSTLRLTGSKDGTPQEASEFTFTELTELPGGYQSGGGGLVPLPDGGSLNPPAGWGDLDPDLEYCARITSFGRNDQAALPVTSNEVCATVTTIDLTDSDATGGGCAVADIPRGGRSLPWSLILAVAAWGGLLARRRARATAARLRRRRPRPRASA